ncbi:TetR/AcrR family transcriptional regulator [Microbacterium sp. A94]|uniref:TetR/AcrR family transcriptional regulator n=1 Tax=Microbacterium sp. A94 TaxID=3450717 RepID=UPI003F424382
MGAKVSRGDRRSTILRSVIDEIVASEAPDVAMARVVASSGAALKTIYRYFGSKDVLLAEALREWYRGVIIEATSPQNTGSGTIATITLYLEGTLRAFAQDLGMTRLLVHNFTSTDPAVTATLAGMQEDANQALIGHLGSDSEPELVLAHSLTTYGASRLAMGAGSFDQVLNDAMSALALIGER